MTTGVAARLSQGPSWVPQQQAQGLLGMGSGIAAGFRQVGPVAANGQANDQVIERRHDISEGRGLGSARIFMERDIPTIVQTILDTPMVSIQLEEACGRGCCGGQTRDAVGHVDFDFTRHGLDVAALDLEDLLQAWPIRGLGQQTARG